MPEDQRYALILVKGYGLGDLTIAHTVEPLSKELCESMLTDALTNPPLDTRFGGACVLMRGEWLDLDGYAVEESSPESLLTRLKAWFRK
jgi:hypothetical protein